MASVHHPSADPGQESLIILQTLLCLLREKNILSRADIEQLCHEVSQRAAKAVEGPLPCCPDSALAASQEMQTMSSYIGRRYGGKHARGF